MGNGQGYLAISIDW